MRDSQKTREQLIAELDETRRQLKSLAAADAERKKTASKPAPSEDKFYKAFLSSPDMIIITSIKDGKYIEVNDSFINITGYSREELIGHTIDEFKLFVNPEEQARMTNLLQESGSFKNEEFIFRIKSGEIRQWLCSAEIIDIGGDSCMIAVAADITEIKKMEQALIESEIKFAKAFRSSPQAIAITTLKDGRFIEVNDSYTRLTGFTREDLIGHTAEELKTWVNPADRQKIINTLKQTSHVENLELEFRSKRGSVQIMLCSAEIINIGGEECIIASSTDITERKRIEQDLRDSEEKFSKAFRASPEILAITTMKEGKYIDINDSYTLRTGYSREELIGQSTKDINIWVNPDDRARMIKGIQERGSIYNEEFDFRMKSGEIRTWMLSLEPITIGGESCLIGLAIDITERKQMESALRESEEKYAKAFRASPEIISITRLSDGVFKEFNESFLRVFGYTRGEVINRKSLELGIWVTPSDRGKMLKKLKEKGRVSNEEYLFRNKAGEIRTMLFSAEEIEYDGEPCVLAVTNDITEHKRMEEQALEAENLRQVDRLRTELLANVSHELRTPLASIKGFATMLMDYDKRLTSLEKREYLETIDKNADRLVELIEQLLEMSRLGVGMLSIKKAPADVIILCQTVIAEARVRAPGHVFTSELSRKLPKINIDERRIRQVLDNVIDNAVKYSNPGTEIALSVRKAGNDILFTVTDHGVGISKKDLPRLFSRMFHSPRGQKSGVPGAGLGLSICKGLIEVHGGKIWIESEEGIGTRCYFTLPIESQPVKKNIIETEEDTILVVKKKPISTPRESISPG